MKPAFSQMASLIALPAMLLLSCSKPAERAGTAEGAKGRPVTVARVEPRPMERAVIAVGSLTAREQATLSVKVPGRLQTMAVDLGSVVKQGDLSLRWIRRIMSCA
jgi:multidrug efflux pump subunit AcrA (membrane-fusion protein)